MDPTILEKLLDGGLAVAILTVVVLAGRYYLPEFRAMVKGIADIAAQLKAISDGMTQLGQRMVSAEQRQERDGDRLERVEADLDEIKDSVADIKSALLAPAEPEIRAGPRRSGRTIRPRFSPEGA